MVLRRLTATRVAVAYAAVGLAWVGLSDRILAALGAGVTARSVTEPALVVASAAGIFVLFRSRRRALAESRAECERASRRADVLQRILRHNVRNTVNVARGYAELLADGTDDPRREAFAGEIIDSVDDLVETSQQARALAVFTEPEPTDTEVVDLAAIARQSARDLGAQHPDAAIEVDLPETLRVRAHPHLDQGIRNPMENGILHNDAATPRVRVELEEIGPGSVTVAVVDNGPGVPDVEREVLESGTETALVHSTGLGLWITRTAIDRSGGEVAIEDREDGTAVVLTLPAADERRMPGISNLEFPYPRPA